MTSKILKNVMYLEICGCILNNQLLHCMENNDSTNDSTKININKQDYTNDNNKININKQDYTNNNNKIDTNKQDYTNESEYNFFQELIKRAKKMSYEITELGKKTDYDCFTKISYYYDFQESVSEVQILLERMCSLNDRICSVYNELYKNNKAINNVAENFVNQVKNFSLKVLNTLDKGKKSLVHDTLFSIDKAKRHVSKIETMIDTIPIIINRCHLSSYIDNNYACYNEYKKLQDLISKLDSNIQIAVNSICKFSSKEKFDDLKFLSYINKQIRELNSYNKQISLYINIIDECKSFVKFKEISERTNDKNIKDLYQCMYTNFSKILDYL